MLRLKKLNGWIWRHKRAVGIVLLAAPLYLPPAQVLFVRFVNPSSSGPRFFDRFRIDSTGQPVKRQQMLWLELKNAPPLFLSGVLMAEDTGFYQHHGFDWTGIKIS